ncbi:unnamed protein product [Rhizophagus irregularis]|nr:unnamed protein product [Rhizophagus irregularis]CAB5395913.1 unnamed protein product [Rhizophagus irregularis]
MSNLDEFRVKTFKRLLKQRRNQALVAKFNINELEYIRNWVKCHRNCERDTKWKMKLRREFGKCYKRKWSFLQRKLIDIFGKHHKRKHIRRLSRIITKKNYIAAPDYNDVENISEQVEQTDAFVENFF